MALRPDTLPGPAGDFHSGSGRGVEGFYRLARQVNGQWWLVDPAGRPCFLRAVHGVRTEPPDTDTPIAPAAATRLRGWGFNAVGVASDSSGRDDGLPFLAAVDFIRAAPAITARHVRLPDVFAPDWTSRAMEHAAVVCGPFAHATNLVAWVSDAEIDWGPPAQAAAPGLLQVCLSLEPSFAAYHAAWEFVLALHAGRLEAVARAWSVPLPNKEVVRELTRTDTGIRTRGYLRDDTRWTREFSQRYFGATGQAVRAAAPSHLRAGCRMRTAVGPAVLAAAAYPASDLALVHWTELPGPGHDVMPVLGGEVGWTEMPADVVAATGRQRLTTFERMLRRGRVTLKRLAQHPAVVGYCWRQWRDDPGEQPPFAHGLVHANDQPAREHTELLADFNSRAENVRRAAGKMLSV